MPTVPSCESTDGKTALPECEGFEGKVAVEACPDDYALSCDDGTWWYAFGYRLEIVEWEVVNGTNGLGCGMEYPGSVHAHLNRSGVGSYPGGAYGWSWSLAGGELCLPLVTFTCTGALTVTGQYCACVDCHWYSFQWVDGVPVPVQPLVERLPDGNFRITQYAFRNGNPSLPAQPCQWDLRVVFETQL